MANVVERGSLSARAMFAPELVTDLVNKVKGKSALAQLCGASPLPFNGRTEYTFNMDDEVNVVAESGAKARGAVSFAARTIIPIKVEYGARLSDEFMYAAEAEQIDILKNFNEGYARKIARGLDYMAFHGVNPRTGTASAIIGNNCFDKGVSQKVAVTNGTTPDAQIEAAIALVQANEEDVSGIAMSPAMRSNLAAMVKTTGDKVFPELAWGSAPGVINGLPVQVNSTVARFPDVTESGGTTTTVTDYAVVGNFEAGFRWGYAKEIPMEIIQYGDPDNSGADLKGHNQIYVRCETYLGWAILEPTAFALIQKTVVES